MKHLLLAVTILSASVVANANPCFVVTPDFAGAYNLSRAVFIGDVVKITRPDESLTASTLKDRSHKVTFKVEYSWKGAGFQDVGIPDLVVLSFQGSGPCESWLGFVEGRKYLVYAEETPEKDLIVGLGSRTMALDLASDDLKKLRAHDFFSSARLTRRLMDESSPFDWPVVRRYVFR